MADAPRPPRPRPSGDAARRRRAAARRAQIRRRRAAALAILILIVVTILLLVFRPGCGGAGGTSSDAAGLLGDGSPAVTVDSGSDGIKLATFLGTESRRFYGLGPAPARLKVIWKTRIGGGWTSGKYSGDPPMYWSGTGWTGMPALVRDGGRLYLLIGGYDHHLRKIDAETGQVVWEYDFGDVIKSSPSVIANPHATGQDDRYLVIAGSRRGTDARLGDRTIAPYRAVTFGSGEEVWRLPEPRTAAYSQDCDGSGFFVDGRQYIGLEDGWFYGLDPFATKEWVVGNAIYREPLVPERRLLLGDPSSASREKTRPEGANLCIEASPALLGDVVFISSGSGHVYGLRRSDLAVVFDYKTGSDLDGTTVPTRAGKLLVPVEKQYIPGHGGVLLLDPRRPARESVVWFFPTGNRKVSEWRGGVIGSVAVNDEYGGGDHYPPLAAFTGIDGYLHVVSQEALAEKRVRGPNLEPNLRTPLEVYRDWLDSSVSTPIFADGALVAAGYDNRVHLYRIAYTPSEEGRRGALRSRDGHWWTVKITETATFKSGSSFESTPIVWQGRVYIGCRDGFFYCLGDK